MYYNSCDIAIIINNDNSLFTMHTVIDNNDLNVINQNKNLNIPSVLITAEDGILLSNLIQNKK